MEVRIKKKCVACNGSGKGGRIYDNCCFKCMGTGEVEDWIPLSELVRRIDRERKKLNTGK